MHHLWIANGSLMELETHLETARRLRYIDDAEIHRCLEKTATIGNMLRRLLHGLGKHDRRHPTPGTRHRGH